MFLLKNGAKKDLKSVDDWTPKHVTIYHRKGEIAVLCDFPGFESPDPLPKEGARRYSGCVCDGCECVVYGPRYNCRDCEDYDYCFKCYKEVKDTHDSTHTFAEISV